MAKPEHLDHHEVGTASSSQQKLTLFALTAMVVGSMVGSGIFSLPRTFGIATGPVRRDHRVVHRSGRDVHPRAGIPGPR